MLRVLVCRSQGLARPPGQGLQIRTLRTAGLFNREDLRSPQDWSDTAEEAIQRQGFAVETGPLAVEVSFAFSRAKLYGQVQADRSRAACLTPLTPDHSSGRRCFGHGNSVLRPPMVSFIHGARGQTLFSELSSERSEGAPGVPGD